MLPDSRFTDEPLPLAYCQERLWFLDQLQPGVPFFYVVTSALRLEGALDADVLQRALNAIVARHDALRSSFPSEQGVPRQHIAAQLQIPLAISDLSSLPRAQRETGARATMRAAAAVPFDLAAGPLLRAHLLRLGGDQHILLLTMHHIISDGWSVNLFVRELSSLYDALVRGRPSPLAPLDYQYADFTLWQRQLLQGELLGKQLAYWRRQLAGVPSLLELPTDRPRRALQSYSKAILAVHLDAPLTERLSLLSRRRNATLFMTILAALQTFICRYSGQRDIAIGSLIANRNHAELEPLIGFFVNTLVLRNRLDPQQSFTDLLGQVRSTTLGAYAHQDLPFQLLLDALNVPRSLSHCPLFQLMLVMQHAPQPMLAGDLNMRVEGDDGQIDIYSPVHAAGTDVGPCESAAKEVGTFDLTLNLTQMPDGLHGRWEYNSELFERDTIERMQGLFSHLLEQVAAHPDIPLQQLKLPDEPHALFGRCGHLAVAAADAPRAMPQAVAPRTPLEQTLAVIWAALLGCGPIGVHDNFFALGGNSLLAVKLFHAMKQQVPIRFPLVAIFSAQTIAELAEMIEAG